MTSITKARIINTIFYRARTKGQFRQAVLGFLSRLNELGHDLTPLLTLNFHLFELQTTS